MENYEEDIYYKRVGFGPRFGALIIDAVILMAIGYALKLVLGIQDPNPEDFVGLPMGEIMLLSFKNSLASTIVGMLYMSMEIFLRKTPGKMALGLIIADEGMTTPSMSALITRNLFKQISSILFVLAILLESATLIWIGILLGFIYLIGCFFTLGEKRMAFHDMLAKTAVYKEKELAEEN